MDGELRSLLDRGLDLSRSSVNGEPPRRVVVLTGAGISAESGIPTFRGPEGFWTVGSENYHPQEMATHRAFSRMPEEVWRWYLYRLSACRGAEPNRAHHALVELERALGDRFLLITQNVDGLHRRAGNSDARTYEIHGNINFIRCDDEEPARLLPLPEELGTDWTAETPFTDEARALLSCCDGKHLARPHVLWFDECYDEALFRYESSIIGAASAALLIVIGTSGSTNLPMQVGAIVAQLGAPMLVINQDESPFSQFAEDAEHGRFLQGSAGELLPPVARYLAEHA